MKFTFFSVKLKLILYPLSQKGQSMLCFRGMLIKAYTHNYGDKGTCSFLYSLEFLLTSCLIKITVVG